MPQYTVHTIGNITTVVIQCTLNVIKSSRAISRVSTELKPTFQSNPDDGDRVSLRNVGF
jgi:hypothetical protein